MKLIVGLGNPGEKYSESRHNVGFLFLDKLREKFLWQKGYDITEWNKQKVFNSELCFLKQGSRVLAMLQKPLTYMNRSGDAVERVVKKFDIENIEEDLILVHDDLDLPLGKFKIQKGKSPLGHKGVRSIEEKLHTANFKRVRVGIENREGMGIVGEDYVLMKFSKEEKEVLEEIIQESIAGILSEILM